MRRRLLVSTVGVTVAVLLLLAFPILVVLRATAEDEARRQLLQEAEHLASVIDDELDADRLPSRGVVLASSPFDSLVTVTLADGSSLVVGQEPGQPSVSSTATHPSGATVTVATESIGLDDRFGRDVIAMFSLVLVGVAAAAGFAIVLSRRLARPFEELAVAARRFGSGDFSANMPPASGIAEIDNISRSLADSATRLEQMFVAERSFTGDATHQLRTGLTGISLRLEMLAMHADAEVRAEAEAALTQTGQLDETITELLDLARMGRAEHRMSFDLDQLVAEHVADWARVYEAAGRVVTVVVGGSAGSVVGTPGFAGQVVDLLLSNSLQHGGGVTRIRMVHRGLEVTDGGVGITPDREAGLFDQPLDPGAPHGRGLPLARRLAEADGGSLELVDAPTATFRYVLLAAEESNTGTDDERHVR